MNAVDTNVLVYAVDDDEPTKQAKANELLDRLALNPAETIIFWQVAAEFLAVLRRWQDVGRVTAQDVEDSLRDILSVFRLRTPRKRIFKISTDLRSRFSLSHWDSMLIAACKEAGVDVLYSEDMDDGADYDGVRIENPFA
jgi:predicted nucleic acid-binding protein